MGFFTLFEQGTRTDIIIQKANKQLWAKVELEWMQPIRERFNETQKLSVAAEKNEADIFILIRYSERNLLDDNLLAIERGWPHKTKRLVVFLIVVDQKGDKRQLRTLNTYRVISAKLIECGGNTRYPGKFPARDGKLQKPERLMLKVQTERPGVASPSIPLSSFAFAVALARSGSYASSLSPSLS